ncbi:MarR family transcriptional regulator [Actinoplanes ianthinogenes]|uniref:MarR family transcriptional regulator n=1 Tax=Actinoplanes ianthinogenes TaxID=122358 RepID=A0ABM7LLY6_9ACTN|nr:MarR family winged helix-turn-helix transcriptional regulator [Actinoplanes ianthinogenes]BCJ40255.1 MarR family transcriptional regulator [Actinoplanes ianthinogenes]GGR11210.1 MarR family transcriptional regulator [Actinoplanes ianthinogenes]
MTTEQPQADEPRWLEAEETATWLAMIKMITRLPAALDADLQHNSGLSFFEYQVLAGLSMQPDRRRRMSDLAEFSACSLSRLSHTARRLESKGWLYREPDPADGRYTLAVLTDAGWDKVVATAPGHVAGVRRMLIDALTPTQYKQLRQISERVNDAIGNEPCTGAHARPVC